MISRRTCVFWLLVLSLLFPVMPLRAIDPVTMAILAPIALRGARIASPYAIRAMQCTGTRMVMIGEDMVDICRLPLGMAQCTFLAPAGQFRTGLQNSLLGGMAPFKLTWDLLLLPLCIFGIAG